MRRPTRSAPCSSCSTRSTPDTGPRAATTESPALRRGFSFALRRSPPGIRGPVLELELELEPPGPIAQGEPPPWCSSRRPGSTGRAARPGIRGARAAARRPPSAAARCRPGPRPIGSIGPGPMPIRRAAGAPPRGPRRRSKGHVSDKQYSSISYRP